VVQALLAALCSDAEKVRGAAATALPRCRSRSPEAVPALVATLRGDAAESVRRAAAFSLGWLGSKSPEAKRALDVAFRGDAAESVRQAAASALKQISET
jgi:HEAT repeat protein